RFQHSPITPSLLCFFFQAEDGIRDRNVTGVQTCAFRSQQFQSPFFIEWLIAIAALGRLHTRGAAGFTRARAYCFKSGANPLGEEIGRASCRERVERGGGAARFENKEKAATASARSTRTT